MYDRSSGQRPASYGYAQYPVSSPPKHYPAAHSSSSAFSASANPNEDWTKISDLAERRRIQNRIAQRNYRKKLKKRLEDLERRAGSDSASPEQRPAELADIHDDDRHDSSSSSGRRMSTMSSQRARTPDSLRQQYGLPVDDQGVMFAQQSFRQLTTSPSPFQQQQHYGSYPPTTCYPAPGTATTMDMPSMYQPYMQQMQSSFGHPTLSSPPTSKEVFPNDDEMNPWSMSYASMASGVDIASTQAYPQDMPAYTPSLSDSFDLSHADSPPDLTIWPVTPPMLSIETPELDYYNLFGA